MKAIKFLTFLYIKIINLFLILLPVKKDRIVVSSYFSKSPEGNIKCILEELAGQGNYDIHTLFLKYENSLKAKIKYFFNIIREIYYFNTSKLIILEGNSPVLSAIKKKKGVFALQVWHASGAFKKFGQDTDRIYKVKGIDAAVVSSKSVAGIYANALNIPVENIYALGTPRMDPLFEAGTVKAYRDEIFKKYNLPEDKKLLLYAPTFRGRGADDIYFADIDLKAVSLGIGDEYTLSIRLHPLMRGLKLFEGFADLGSEDLIKTLCAADILITDYSSIIFEFSALMRPMLFLVPDLEDYIKSRGFYRDFKSFVPGKICMNEKELVTALKKKDFEREKVAAFAGGHLDFKDNLSAKRVTGLINCFMQDVSPVSSELLPSFNKTKTISG